MISEKEQNVTIMKSHRGRYIIAVIILLLCILAGYIYLAVTWTPVDSESKKASEAVIRQAVAAQLTTEPNNPIDPNNLTDEDFAKIKEFKIEKFAFLTAIQINKGQDVTLADVLRKNISGMPDIYLELSDIRMLEKFINLQNLTLSYIKFPQKDIPIWMTVMAKIGIIDLSKRFSLDLGPLENLTKLQGLSLAGSQISNLESLKDFINLQELDITLTQVSDLEPLKDLENLQKLHSNRTQISDIGPLKELTNLQELWLGMTKVSDLEPLNELKNLQILWIYNTLVSDLEPIKELLKLQSLCIDNTPVSDLEPLRELKNLRYLYISNCPNITDEQVEDLQKALPELEIIR